MTHKVSDLSRGFDPPPSQLGSGSQWTCGDEARTPCFDAVLINPEPKAHVGISHEVEDSTTADVLVKIHVTIAKGHSGCALEQVDVDIIASVRGTECSEGEHVNSE